MTPSLRDPVVVAWIRVIQIPISLRPICRVVVGVDLFTGVSESNPVDDYPPQIRIQEEGLNAGTRSQWSIQTHVRPQNIIVPAWLS